MASALAKYEDSTLRKVLAVTLSAASADSGATPPVVHLAALEQELRAELGGSSDAPVLLSRDNVERALMARLSEPPPSYPQWPVHYLIGVYARASDEQRNVGMLKDPSQQADLSQTLLLCRQLAVSYAGLTLLIDMFPQPPEAEQRRSLQLLDSLDASAAASAASLGFGGTGGTGSSSGAALAGGAAPMPPGFLEDFGARFADEGLGDLVEPIVLELARRAGQVSLLGDWTGIASMYARLASVRPLARAVVQLPAWLPKLENGRIIEQSSLLGPLFGISATLDLTEVGMAARRLPDIAQQCFAGAASRRPGEVRQSMLNLQSLARQLQQQLHGLVMLLLKNQETREPMLSWLAAALNSNLERAKLQPDPRRAATDGFMLNLAAVLLRLCEPFLDPTSGKAWGKLDARYVSDPNARLTHGPDVTRLNADSEQVAAWFKSVGRPADGKYHFICECFFMAARGLQLGLKRGFDNHSQLVRTVQHFEEDLEAMRRGPLAGMPQARMLEARGEWLKCARLALEALLQDHVLLQEALSFYRLVAAYLLRLASPAAATGGEPSLPLPEPPNKELCVLPEYFVEDLGETLLWVGQIRPDLVESGRMKEFMVFFTTFLGAPSYVKNAFLRGKMVQALHSYMPPEAMPERQRVRVPASAAELATLFEVHPLVVQNIVRSLIQLYIDIEITDRHNTFYEKFNTRYQIGEILTYLWNLPQHREAWRAGAQAEPQLHVRFIHVLLNDSQFLLQDALETLPKVQATEQLQARPAEWQRLSQQERDDREAALQQQRQLLKSDFYLASIIIKLMQATADDRAVASCYFDPAVRNRTAKINDFFLKYLTVPEERKRLRVKDPEQYHWNPKQLISQLAQIHLSLYRARPQEWVQAVAADTDYYGRAPQLFGELLSLLRELSLLPQEDIAELAGMVAAVEQYKASVAEEEEAFEDVPEEFEDPLLGGIMRDPVRLPSGNIVERSSILQQLMSDPRDPYSRQPCRVEDLEAMDDLRARIQAWVQEQRGKRARNA